MTDLENEYTHENWLQAFLRRLWWAYLIVGGLALGYAFATLQYRAEAVERSFAHYDSRTGNWEWGMVSDISIEEPMPIVGEKVKKNGK